MVEPFQVRIRWSVIGGLGPLGQGRTVVNAVAVEPLVLAHVSLVVWSVTCPGGRDRLRVRTASGAAAVQVADYVNGRRRIVAHVGSAHTETELGLLMQQAQELLDDPGQVEFDLGLTSTPVKAELLGPVADGGDALFAQLETPARSGRSSVAPARFVATGSDTARRSSRPFRCFDFRR